MHANFGVHEDVRDAAGSPDSGVRYSADLSVSTFNGSIKARDDDSGEGIWPAVGPLTGR